ncbi:MAG: hypothetical protein ACPGYV_08160 [Phycisphaeraceae bacterium]
MQEHSFKLHVGEIDAASLERLSAYTVVRRVFQGVGGGACVTFAAAMPWASFDATGVTLGSVHLPSALLFALGLATLVGLGFFAASVWGLVRRLPAHTRFGVLAIAGACVFSVAGLEYGYIRPGGLVAFEYRPAVRMVCYFFGIMLLACAVPEDIGPRVAALIRTRVFGFKHVLGLALMTVAAGALLGAVVLDGMPHIIDGTSYLIQARILWSGELAMTPPMYPELFAGELMQMRTSDAGYYSKYPVGWPMVLGLFDSIGAPWLANALLAGVLVVLTYAVVAERGSRRMASLSAAGVALCPWLWMNAGTMMAHLASAVWLWLFLWLFLRGTRTMSRATLALSGLVLGVAVVTRPADAAFFALPCVALSTGWLIRNGKVWWTRLPMVAVGAMPGVVGYLWINRRLADGGSTYGGGHGSVLFEQMPESMGHAIIWLQQSWVGLNAQWLGGAVPVAMLLLCGVVFGVRYLRTQWLGIACASSLFLCYGVFVFGGRAWVGPRWYVPLIPAVALLIAAGINAASHAGRVRSPGGVLAAGYLRAAVVAAAVVFLVVVPMRVVELRTSPPHGIDGRVVGLVESAGLSHAVVALPVSGLDPTTGQPNHKRGIAGMWSMRVPFEASDVIYIAAIDGWQAKASAAWPGRDLYTMNDRAGDMTLTPVPSGADR